MNKPAVRSPHPSPGVEGARAYRVPRPSGAIDLYLDGNEGISAPPGLKAALHAIDPETLRRYPDAGTLQKSLAKRLSVVPEQVLVTAGADDALDRTCRAYLCPGRTLVLPSPTFEMFPRYARLAGADTVEVEWSGGPFPTNAAIESCGGSTGVIAVVTPNNPTGAVAAASDLERLSAACPQALLLVDLAYTEFADIDLTAAALALPNAVVARSLSKAWGLAGLRVGYAAGPAPLIADLRAAGGPYAVSGLSLALAQARLDQPRDDVNAFIERIRFERRELERLLRDLGGRPQPSQANFVFARFDDALTVQQALADRGIAVRAFPDRPGLEDALRITCPGNEPAFERLIVALSMIPRPLEAA